MESATVRKGRTGCPLRDYGSLAAFFGSQQLLEVIYKPRRCSDCSICAKVFASRNGKDFKKSDLP